MPGEQEIDFILSDLFFCVKLEKVKYVGRNSMRSSMERLLRYKQERRNKVT